ncbi:MAG: DoxX family protein [Saprospiraceae bacterium]|nr:DoxX family protein [Saprospiraceae bacterium]
MKDLADLIGRICISAIFLYEAYDSIVYFQSTKMTMAEYGLNWRPDLLLVSAITALIIGGICILIGFKASIGAFFLIIYWIPVTFVLYSFWDDPEPLQRINSTHFMKNLAILGGLLIIMVNGSGKYSVKRLLSYTRL